MPYDIYLICGHHRHNSYYPINSCRSKSTRNKKYLAQTFCPECNCHVLLVKQIVKYLWNEPDKVVYDIEQEAKRLDIPLTDIYLGVYKWM